MVVAVRKESASLVQQTSAAIWRAYQVGTEQISYSLRSSSVFLAQSTEAPLKTRKLDGGTGIDGAVKRVMPIRPFDCGVAGTASRAQSREGEIDETNADSDHD
jgi:hypothetical protein